MSITKVVATKRTSLYRMVDGCTVVDAFTEAKRSSSDFFEVVDLEIESRAARLVHGALSVSPKWATDVSLLTGQKVTLSNSSPGAALALVDGHGTVWAITWGSGFHFLDGEQIDYGFGPGIVARSALAAEVKSLTKTVLDHRARVDRSSMPNGSTVRDLGVDGYGEVVSRIEAKARIPGLVADEDVIHLRAAESLNLPLAKRAPDLLKDLEVLHDLSLEPVLPGLEGLEQLIALKPRDSRVAALDEKLLDEIYSAKPSRIGLSWPHERLGTYGPVESVKVTGIGDSKRRHYTELPDSDLVLGWLRALPRSEALDKLKSIRIELHSTPEPESGSLVSTPVPIRRWLAFEVRESGERFCLHDGNWYRMDDKYLARIDERVEEILRAGSSVSLPPWPPTEDEKSYNIRAAAAIGGYAIDRKLIGTPLHSRGGIEPCDIFVPAGTLIHVKRGRSSADLSHLLAQGLVSADSLARDENARFAWKRRVEAESGSAYTDADVLEVVLAIGSARPVTVESLFTFTKVNLVKQVDALRYLEVQVQVVGVPEA